jgi:hypothetical protein
LLMGAHGEITTPAGKVPLPAFPHWTREDTRLLLPREHGSWALWILPLISGTIAGCLSQPGAALAPALWFSSVAMAAFLIHQPLESLLGLSLLKVRSGRERRIAAIWVGGWTMIAVLGLARLLRMHRGLVFALGLVALACFGLAALFGHARSLRVSKQFVGALGLTSSAAGAYYATTGRLSQTALLLWLAFWIFAAGQIEYVQLRLRTARMATRAGKARAGWKITSLHLLATAAMIAWTAAAGATPWLALVFVPATVRLLAWMAGPFRPLRLHLLGFTELLQSIIFAALLTAALLT